jgi:eukaryotic-like serine/threonine-protein kinase
MLNYTIGNYQIQTLVGEGGMGTVFKGLDLMLEREVAIKVLRPELARQPQLVERFRAEAVTLARINHPYVATLHTLLRHGDDFLMVMEFVRGETLEAILRRHGALTMSQALRLFSQVLEGIAHAHHLGIVHRDLKPANLMLTENGTIKVMDFGIARLLGSARQTRTGRIVGTLEYMSPEQVRGLETDARSDIYSLGIVLYEMLTGRAPFRSDSEYEVMHAHLEMPPPPPRHFAHHIAPAIEQIIMRALAKDPAERFQSALDFHAALIDAARAARLILDPLPSDVTPAAAPPFTPALPSHPSAPSQPGLNPGGLAEQLIKATRMAQATGASAAPLPGAPNSARFARLRQQLNGKHYAGAAAALLVLSGAVWVGSRQPQRPLPTHAEESLNFHPTPQPTAVPAEMVVPPSFTAPPQPGGPIPADALSHPSLSQPATVATSATPQPKAAPKRRTPSALPYAAVAPTPAPTIFVRTPAATPRPTPATTAAVEEEQRKKEKDRVKREEKESDEERTLRAVGGILSGAKDIWGSLKGDKKKEKKRP